MSEILEKLSLNDKHLDEYVSHHGVPLKSWDDSNKEIEQYLSMSIEQMERLTSEKCANIACRLSQFSFHLQKIHNRERARKTYLDAQLKKIIVKEIDDYSGSWEHKEMKVINNNEFAGKIYDQSTALQQRLDRISYLAASVQHIADRFSILKYTKGNNNAG